MKTPDEVAAMLRLKALGWGVEADRARAGLQPHDGPALFGRGGWRRCRGRRPAAEAGRA